MNTLTTLYRILSIYRRRCQISSLSSSTSSTNFYSKLKQLFHFKQYQQILDLFDQQSREHTNAEITLALKACILSSQYQRGVNIEKQLSSKALNDPYIQTTLLQLYSKSLFFLPDKDLKYEH